MIETNEAINRSSLTPVVNVLSPFIDLSGDCGLLQASLCITDVTNLPFLSAHTQIFDEFVHCDAVTIIKWEITVKCFMFAVL